MSEAGNDNFYSMTVSANGIISTNIRLLLLLLLLQA